ncbi:winged helix-turn-helix domain-containing protein [Streptomyces sp. NPDC001941]|uniref:winged helix-turn-helix domain-containing protein n=1 Tax=Streptomyces sp. NPDC001941 TaxID=3154659 RepID=UPI003322F469
MNARLVNIPSIPAPRRNRRAVTTARCDLRPRTTARTGIRHTAADLPHAPVHRAGDLVVDTDRRRVSVDGRELRLTVMEFELIAHLAAHRGRAFTRAELMERVWQLSDTDGGRTVDTHVDRLRHKLGRRHRALLRTVGDAFALDAWTWRRPAVLTMLRTA